MVIKALRRGRFGAHQPDRQDDPGNRDRHGRHFLQRQSLLPSQHDVQQHPYRSGVLHYDGDRNAGFLDGNVIKIVGRRHAEHPDHQALHQVPPRHLDSLPSATAHEDGKQHQQRKRSARLREDQRIDGMYRFTPQRESSSEYCAPENSGNSPQKRRRRDEKIPAQWMRCYPAGSVGVQDSVTESDDGGSASNWSRRSGSNPTTTSSTPSTNTTSVGVSSLSCCSTMALRASGSEEMLCSSKAIPFASRNTRINSQERQPD